MIVLWGFLAGKREDPGVLFWRSCRNNLTQGSLGGPRPTFRENREGVSFHPELLTGSPGRARDKRTGLGGEQEASGRWESRDQPAEPLPQSLGFIGPFPFVAGNWQLKLLRSSWEEGRKPRGPAQVTFPVLISSPLISHPTPRGNTSLGVLFSSV